MLTCEMRRPEWDSNLLTPHADLAFCRSGLRRWVQRSEGECTPFWCVVARELLGARLVRRTDARAMRRAEFVVPGALGIEAVDGCP